jgi:signal transduction histidine kinase
MTADETFLSSVAHDLRGQLNTIVTGVHYLLRYETNLGQTSRDMLGRVNGAGQRMRRLLEEFDHAVWIDGGNLAALVLAPCHANLLIKGVIDRLTQAIESREVTIDLQLPPGLPPFNADAELCGVAVEYVLDFALSRSRKKTVHLTAALIDGQTVLSIADEGGSIPEDAQGRLFDPFVERELVSKVELGQWKRERLGLGLAIARGILAAHGGAITAESAPDGQGLILRCALHRAEGAVAAGLHPR